MQTFSEVTVSIIRMYQIPEDRLRTFLGLFCLALAESTSLLPYTLTTYCSSSPLRYCYSFDTLHYHGAFQETIYNTKWKTS